MVKICIGAGRVDVLLTIIGTLFSIKNLWTFSCAKEGVPERFYYFYAYNNCVGRNDAVVTASMLRARRFVD